jgi:hypothetical protein
MFCPNCGKGEQTPGGYCRNCGQFLLDAADRFSLVSKLLGINTPERQLYVNLIITISTCVFSSLLLIFLIGYFDGRHAKTGESAPTIIYLVYVFLGLVSSWQVVSVINSLVLMGRLSRSKRGQIEASTPDKETALSAAQTQNFLPPARSEHVAPTSVTERTTKILDK